MSNRQTGFGGTLWHPVFCVSMLLFVLNQTLELAQVYIWPLHTHLDDLLCLPISLTIILAAERLYFQNPEFILPRRYIVLAVLLFGLVFEGILPLLSARYTADIIDVFAYIIGAAIFQASINRVKKATV